MQDNALYELLRRYDRACDVYTAETIAHAGAWHRADVEEFSELFESLLPHAYDGESLAQYAVATILWLGMRCETQQEQFDHYQASVTEASRWWIAAAKQGHLGALDNLLTSGVGAEADHLRRIAELVQVERPELVSWSDGMPCFGREYFLELFERTYGPSSSGGA